MRRRRVRRDRREHRHGGTTSCTAAPRTSTVVGLRLRAPRDGRVDQRDHGHALVGMNNNGGDDLAVRPALVGRRRRRGPRRRPRSLRSPGSPPTRSAARPTPGAAPGSWATSAGFRVRVIDSSNQPNKDMRLDGLRGLGDVHAVGRHRLARRGGATSRPAARAIGAPAQHPSQCRRPREMSAARHLARTFGIPLDRRGAQAHSSRADRSRRGLRLPVSAKDRGVRVGRRAGRGTRDLGAPTA